MKYEYILGIDPGNNGAIVCYDVDEDQWTAKKMLDTPRDIYEYFNSFKGLNVFACLEQVHGRPGMAGTAMFTFGRNYGSVLTSLHANDIAFQTTTPQAWQKIYQLGSSKGVKYGDWKNKLKEKAQQLFPYEKITLWNADAFLLAEFIRRQLTK